MTAGVGAAGSAGVAEPVFVSGAATGEGGTAGVGAAGSAGVAEPVFVSCAATGDGGTAFDVGGRYGAFGNSVVGASGAGWRVNKPGWEGCAKPQPRLNQPNRQRVGQSRWEELS